MASEVKLSANIELLFREAGDDPADRVRAAAAAGFTAVDIWWQSNKDLPALRDALVEAGVGLTTLVVEGYCNLPDPAAQETFLTNVVRATEAAAFLGCPYVVTGSGAASPSRNHRTQYDATVAVLRRAAVIAADHGTTIVLENLNTRVDHPGILFDTVRECAAAVREVDSPGLALMVDLYHATQMRENLPAVLADARDVLAHVQGSDTPGRTEPGSGGIDWEARLRDLLDLGYTGALSLEYTPTTDTVSSLAHIREVAGRLGIG